MYKVERTLVQVAGTLLLVVVGKLAAEDRPGKLDRRPEGMELGRDTAKDF